MKELTEQAKHELTAKALRLINNYNTVDDVVLKLTKQKNVIEILSESKIIEKEKVNAVLHEIIESICKRKIAEKGVNNILWTF